MVEEDITAVVTTEVIFPNNSVTKEESLILMHFFQQVGLDMEEEDSDMVEDSDMEEDIREVVSVMGEDIMEVIF